MRETTEEKKVVKPANSKLKKTLMTAGAVAAAGALSYGISLRLNVSSNETIGAGAVKEERNIKGDDNSNNTKRDIKTGDITGETINFN